MDFESVPLWKIQSFVNMGVALGKCVVDPITLQLDPNWTQVLEWCCSMAWYDIRDSFFPVGLVKRMGPGDEDSILDGYGNVRPECLTETGQAFVMMARIAKDTW